MRWAGGKSMISFGDVASGSGTTLCVSTRHKAASPKSFSPAVVAERFDHVMLRRPRYPSAFEDVQGAMQVKGHGA